jgi:hypothetical protein
MGQAAARSDFSRALSAMVVAALLVATTALMLVTFQTARAGALASYTQVTVAAPESAPLAWRAAGLENRR